jgi:hypothetical protein
MFHDEYKILFVFMDPKFKFQLKIITVVPYCHINMHGADLITEYNFFHNTNTASLTFLKLLEVGCVIVNFLK